MQITWKNLVRLKPTKDQVSLTLPPRSSSGSGDGFQRSIVEPPLPDVPSEEEKQDQRERSGTRNGYIEHGWTMETSSDTDEKQSQTSDLEDNVTYDTSEWAMYIYPPNEVSILVTSHPWAPIELLASCIPLWRKLTIWYVLKHTYNEVVPARRNRDKLNFKYRCAHNGIRFASSAARDCKGYYRHCTASLDISARGCTIY